MQTVKQAPFNLQIVQRGQAYLQTGKRNERSGASLNCPQLKPCSFLKSYTSFMEKLSGSLRRSNWSLAKSDKSTLLLGQQGAGGKLMLTVDFQFRAAASTSATALRDLLLGIERMHFGHLRATIEPVGVQGS